MAKEKETVPVALVTLTIGILVAIISFWYGRDNGLLPEQVSQQAPLVDNFFRVMVTVGTALFLLVEGAIVFALFKFRRRPDDDTDAPPIKGNFSLEVFWTAIPAVIVIGLGIYSVDVYNRMGGFDTVGSTAVAHHHGGHATQLASLPGSSDVGAPLLSAAAPQQVAFKYGLGATPAEGQASPFLEIAVKGLQYAWLFTYPNGMVTGELHVPVGEDVRLNITAQDVLHSFWLPEFRIKQDAIPGETTELRFTPTKTGTYPVVCAELCGAYHGSMRSQIIIQEPDEYEQWVAENQPVAVTTGTDTVALHPSERSDADFLAPYAAEWGIDAAAIAPLQPERHA
ncbi:MAG: cytochrome c oxidase subunit II [Spirulinaceae cyanobacterium SM2_1_0]|nr:cytochrome c oxidase subunit II [Spirulinaceae cyanobacterium SM2_1_0]